MPSEDSPTSEERCSYCGALAIRRDRFLAGRSCSIVEAVACESCGEWWFEANGERMTPQTIIDLDPTS